MPFILHYLPAYLAAVSLLSIIVCVFDKHRAKRHGRRICERTLLLLSGLGGSAAMYLTMRAIHHKTRHKKFMLGLPAMMIAQLFLLFFLYRY